MRKKVYAVALTDDERQELHVLIHGGTTRARMVNRAQILLHASGGGEDREIASALHTSESTVGHIRKRFVEDGLHGALHEVGLRLYVRVSEKGADSGLSFAVTLACELSPPSPNP